MSEDNASKKRAMSLSRSLTRRQFLGFLGTVGLAAGTGALVSGCASGSSQSASSSADSAQSATHTVTDMAGNEVEVPNEITAYADGWYAHNEVSIMLNGGQGMVATHCDPKTYKWMYKVCPNMKDATVTFGKDFNFEDLAALGPQVIFDSAETLRDKANEVGIPLVDCMFTDYDKMKQSVTLTAEVFGGDAPDIAQCYNDELDQTLSDIQSKLSGLSDSQKPKVMSGNSVYKHILDGTETIVDTWIQVCGGTNAVQESTKGNPQQEFSLEQIVNWNPDVIITGKPAEVDQILQDPDWQTVSAVQKQQVYVNPKGVFGWNRYGVEELLQLKWASQLLHPEVFSDVDIAQETKDFYRDFLRYDLTDEEAQLILGAKDPQD